MIKDFSAGEKTDISDVLDVAGYDSDIHTQSDWVCITTHGFHSYVSIDPDGTGPTHAMTQIIYTENVTTLRTSDLTTTV